MRKRTIAVTLGILMVLWAAPAFAVEALPCRRDAEDPPDEVLEIDTTGATITFDGCFLVEDYSTGTPVQVVVDWTATDATCNSAGDVTLRGKGYTPPKSADGTVPTTTMNSGDFTSSGFVQFEAAITALKTVGKNGKKSFAKGHFAVPMSCDTISGTFPVSLGVNLRAVNRQ